MNDLLGSPNKSRLREEIKINLEDHMSENTELLFIEHDSIINNPFTGIEDDENDTFTDEMNLKMERYSSSYEPSSSFITLT